jgi:hypothetical protein
MQRGTDARGVPRDQDCSRTWDSVERERVGAENPVTSFDLDVLMKEAAEAVTSARPDDDTGTGSTTTLGGR